MRREGREQIMKTRTSENGRKEFVSVVKRLKCQACISASGERIWTDLNIQRFPVR